MILFPLDLDVSEIKHACFQINYTINARIRQKPVGTEILIALCSYYQVTEGRIDYSMFTVTGC